MNLNIKRHNFTNQSSILLKKIDDVGRAKVPISCNNKISATLVYEVIIHKEITPTVPRIISSFI